MYVGEVRYICQLNWVPKRGGEVNQESPPNTLLSYDTYFVLFVCLYRHTLSLSLLRRIRAR